MVLLEVLAIALLSVETTVLGRVASAGCPNLTIVALAANSLFHAGDQPEHAAWVVLTGLFITVVAVIALPIPPKPVSLNAA